MDMGAVCVYGEHIVIVLPQVFLAEFLHDLKHLFRGRILFEGDHEMVSLPP